PPPSYPKIADSDEVQRLRAEVDRLKREMATLAALLSPKANGLKVEGPSPTSGDRSGQARAEASDRRRKHCSIDSIEEAGDRGGRGGGDGDGDDRGNGSANSDTSMRQMSVFFPVQTPPESKADLDRTASVEGAAALAAAAATQIGAAVSPPEAGRAAQAARNAAVSSRLQQQGPTKQAPTPPVVYAKIPGRSAPGEAEAEGCGRGEACRRRCGAGDGNGRVWRWVLAQRMGDQQVRQALLSHGLPSFGRRHIWAAWSSVAMPETYNRVRGQSDPSKEGPIVSVIMHDVARTKIVHPLFAPGGQGLAMLKRVLLRCAELGAVKEAGYIQGMNYLAGFILITLADGILSEREDDPPLSSRDNPLASNGVAPVEPAAASKTAVEAGQPSDLRAGRTTRDGGGVGAPASHEVAAVPSASFRREGEGS
ncbi:unnamed protein product, partial [Scytosiphon promiscuus]